MQESFEDNEMFRSLIEDISDGIMAIDHNWKVVYLNLTAVKMLSKSRESLLGENIWDKFPGSVGGKFYRANHDALRSQKKTIVEDYSVFLGGWIRATIFPSLKGLTIYFHDITAEKEAKARASKTEADFGLFLDRITDGFIVLDKEFRYVYVNKAIGDLLNRDPQSLIGKNVWEEFPDAVGSTTYKAFQTAFKEQRFICNMDHYAPLQFWQEEYIYPSAEGLSVFIKDVSDRKRLEKELKEKERDLQFELMITALEAEEKERTSIGRELHDNVNQLLVATKLMLALMRDDLAKLSTPILSRCVDNLEKAIQENRKIAHELVTPDLKDESLTEQLGLLLQTMLTPNNIEIAIDARFNEAVLDQQKKLAVYRIAQEQCTNIVKYAKAKRVDLSLSNNDQLFTMIISDDGVGMTKTDKSAGIGLKNIAARVSFFGGHMEITTRKGKGFQLLVTLPVRPATSAHTLAE
jgi:PAS domain S-box-containing protein